MATFKERAARLVHVPYVLFVLSKFLILVVSRFGFEGGFLLLIALVPSHCLLITFILVGFKGHYIIWNLF